MKGKLIVKLEFSRDNVALVAALSDIGVDELWEQLSGQTFTIKPEDIEDKEARLALTLCAMGVAVNEVGKKTKKEKE